MSEPENIYERKVNPLAGHSFLSILFCVIAANVFEKLGWLPYIVGFTLASAIALLIEYWIPPKPPVSFPVWGLKVITLIILILLGLWIIPIFLSRWLWPPLAYGLPTFILFASLYWMPPLYPIKRRDALWKWILLALGFALLMSFMGYYVPYQ